MNAIAHVVFDRAYYESNYDAWLRHRAKLRPYAVYLSLTLLAFGVVMAFAFSAQWLFGVTFACAGVYELIAALTHKSRWVNARVKATPGNKNVELQLSDSELSTASEVAQGAIKIAAFSEIIRASDGVFLIPESGVSIYIPAATVEPTDALSPLVDAWMAARNGR